MEGRDGTDPPVPDQRLDPLEKVELVGDIEVGGRLIEEQDRGLLRERASEEQPLALTAAQLEHPLLGPVGETHFLERSDRERAIVRGLRAEGGLVGVPTVEDVAQDPDVVPRELLLRDPGDPSRALPGSEPAGRRSEEPHLPFSGFRET